MHSRRVFFSCDRVINMKKIAIIVFLFVMLSGISHAGEVTIVDVLFEKGHKTWTVKTQLSHADTGWDHYADAWRVVTELGEELGVRILHHPHVEEQPFTRALTNLEIPRHINTVYVEAHDSVHGWSSQRVRVDLNKTEGPRYRVRK